MRARPNVVIGAGVIGLATARALQKQDPDRTVVVIEKEDAVAQHQSGHNSGVIHSGIYYTPGSLKAVLAIRGREELIRFCDDHHIPYDVPGKLIIASTTRELGTLAALLERGRENQIPVRRAHAEEVIEREPHLRAVGAIYVGTTGRVDYRMVADCLRADIEAAGGEIRYRHTVLSARPGSDGVEVKTVDDSVLAHRVAVCAGLHSDHVARRSGLDPAVRILPFRGEYSRLVGDGQELVNGLVYPVPDPELPFLGIHLTRRLGGGIDIGPNAVPALAREGYGWRTVSPRDLWETVSYPGSWRLAYRYGPTGVREMVRSLSGYALYKAARLMLPELRPEFLQRAGTGVRAQAVRRDGRLEDDFLFCRSGSVLHVLNAPSPGATACLTIGQRIATELLAS